MWTALAVLGKHSERQKDVLSSLRSLLEALLVIPECLWGDGCNHGTQAV